MNIDQMTLGVEEEYFLVTDKDEVFNLGIHNHPLSAYNKAMIDYEDEEGDIVTLTYFRDVLSKIEAKSTIQ